MLKSLFAIAADLSKTLKSVQRSITFIVNVLLKSGVPFFWQLLLSEIKIVVNFTKTSFLQEQDCLRMRNHAERYQSISCCNKQFDIALTIKKFRSLQFTFQVPFSMETKHFRKTFLYMNLFLFLLRFISVAQI